MDTNSCFGEKNYENIQKDMLESKQFVRLRYLRKENVSILLFSVLYLGNVN